MFNYDLEKGKKLKKLKGFDRLFKNKEATRSLSCKKLHKLEEEDDDWESYQFALTCRGADLKCRKILFSPFDIFFINMTRNTIFYFYDSRGLDVVASSKEALSELYSNRNDWILDYDRESIDKVFK